MPRKRLVVVLLISISFSIAKANPASVVCRLHSGCATSNIGIGTNVVRDKRFDSSSLKVAAFQYKCTSFILCPRTKTTTFKPSLAPDSRTLFDSSSSKIAGIEGKCGTRRIRWNLNRRVELPLEKRPQVG